MNGQIALPEPLMLDADGWARLIEQIEGASPIDEYKFVNPGTGNRVKIATKPKANVKVNGELVKRGNLIAKQELNGKLIVAFRLPPICDVIEFEGVDKTFSNTIEQLANLVNGTITMY